MRIPAKAWLSREQSRLCLRGIARKTGLCWELEDYSQATEIKECDSRTGEHHEIVSPEHSLVECRGPAATKRCVTCKSEVPYVCSGSDYFSGDL